MKYSAFIVKYLGSLLFNLWRPNNTDLCLLDASIPSKDDLAETLEELHVIVSVWDKSRNTNTAWFRHLFVTYVFCSFFIQINFLLIS